MPSMTSRLDIRRKSYRVEDNNNTIRTCRECIKFSASAGSILLALKGDDLSNDDDGNCEHSHNIPILSV